MVSILMPVKNAAPFLKECLDSISAQTERDWELIAVNDNSSDNSVELIEDYSRKDSRIKLYNNNIKPGIIGALKTAMLQSHGTFITRMDADDKMIPDKIKLLKNKLQEKKKQDGRFFKFGVVKRRQFFL